MKIKFLKTKKNFKKGEHNINPDFFWQLLLLFAFVLIISFAVFGFLLFQRVSKDSTLDAGSTDGKAQTIRKARIEKVLNQFAEREERSLDILNTTSPVIDPSR